MSALGQKLVNKVISTRAPSAPSAPPVRNFQGSMAAGASATSYGAPANTGSGLNTNTPTGGAAGKKGVDPGPKGIGGRGRLDGPKPKPNQPSQPKPGGVRSVGFVTDDPVYWNNVAALTAQYGTEMQGLKTEQTLANNSYISESNRMATDRSRARRDLAESLLGNGNIYGGAHRRQQVESDMDYVLNRGRLDSDKLMNDQDRLARMADVQSRLGPDVGSEWIREQQAATARAAEQDQQDVATGAPDYSLNRKQRIHGLNTRITNIRKRLKDTEDPDKKKKLRSRLQKARRKRDKLVRRGK